jgi:hypothetical protein
VKPPRPRDPTTTMDASAHSATSAEPRTGDPAAR